MNEVIRRAKMSGLPPSPSPKPAPTVTPAMNPPPIQSTQHDDAPTPSSPGGASSRSQASSQQPSFTMDEGFTMMTRVVKMVIQVLHAARSVCSRLLSRLRICFARCFVRSLMRLFAQAHSGSLILARSSHSLASLAAYFFSLALTLAACSPLARLLARLRI